MCKEEEMSKEGKVSREAWGAERGSKQGGAAEKERRLESHA